jgi:predicted regulator of Ras-like GTPase activity (Roadblock/LC7/MglB family)
MARGPLVLTKEDMEHIHKALVLLLKQSEAKCAVLINQDGECVARRGFTKNLDTDSMAALIAGSFSSTRALAKLIGEPDFSVLFHQGNRDHIHNIVVGDEMILSVIFDDRTTLGMVRLFSRDAGKRLRDILAAARQKSMETLGQHADLEKDAMNRLDDLFQE